MRAYVLTPSFLPGIGGQEMQIHELCAALIPLGVDVLVITRRSLAEYPAQEVMSGVRVARLPPIGESKGAGWAAIPQLALFVLRVAFRLAWDARHYDVVLVSGYNVLPVIAVLVGLVTGRPCIVRPESPLEIRHVVGPESLGKMGLREQSLPVRLLRRLRLAVARRVDRYVAISEEIRGELLNDGVAPASIVSIPNGIDVGKFAPATAERRRELRRRLGLPPAGQILVYTGRLAESKGVMLLAGVWREISAEFPGTHLVMLGSGQGSTDDRERELRDFIASHDLGERLHLPGAVMNVSEYLQASDIFVFASDSEGFGLSILEAMAVGLPMVSTRVGIAADVAARYQPEFLVDARSADQFSEALRRLLRNPERQRAIAASGIREVEQRFSMAAVARQYVEIITLLTRGGTKAGSSPRGEKEAT